MSRDDIGYLSLILESMDLNQLATKTAQPLITGNFVKSQQAPLPPLDEQKAILKYFIKETTRIDTLTAKIREHREKLQEYRTALISAAVTGKIDVRGES